MKMVNGGGNCTETATCADGIKIGGVFDCDDTDGGHGDVACQTGGHGDSISCDCQLT